MEIALKSTLVYNDRREELLGRYVSDRYEEKYIASHDDGLTLSFINSERGVVEAFIKTKQAEYSDRLELYRMITFPFYSKDWKALFEAIQKIQNDRLDIQIRYNSNKLLHLARIYDCVGMAKNPLTALFNALLQWIYKNTNSMSIFKDLQEIDSEEIRIISGERG